MYSRYVTCESRQQTVCLFFFTLVSDRKDSIADDPPSAPQSHHMAYTPSIPASVRNRLKHPRVKPEASLVKVYK